MDTILTTFNILDETNWVFFKIYKDPKSSMRWKSNLDWFHKVLIDIVRPLVIAMSEIRAVFFGFYAGGYELERGEEYEKQITPLGTDVVYIRLRLSTDQNHKSDIKNAFVGAFDNNRTLVWDYETITTYHVRNDLGGRYGSGNDAQTLKFIRYWDSACRYILSILTLPGNWIRDVDVWGTPHLVNNSLGCWLRPNRSPIPCPVCHTSMYMSTFFKLQSQISLQTNVLPVFLFVCPSCFKTVVKPINI